LILPPPTSTLFPYTTLFRSCDLYKILFGNSGISGNKNIFILCFSQSAPSTRIHRIYIRNHFVVLRFVQSVLKESSKVFLHFFCEDRKSTRLNSSHVSISYAV